MLSALKIDWQPSTSGKYILYPIPRVMAGLRRCQLDSFCRSLPFLPTAYPSLTSYLQGEPKEKPLRPPPVC